MLRRSLGSSGILVSELALGTQRWGSSDFNGPDEAACHQMLDLATANGVNLVDTAEQYPIPSDRQHPEGSTEQIIGSWLAKDKSRRKDLVIASKITGGRNVTPRNIEADLQGTLRRLGTDYLDVYLLHWPARYTPQVGLARADSDPPSNSSRAPYPRAKPAPSRSWRDCSVVLCAGGALTLRSRGASHAPLTRIVPSPFGDANA
jgi:aryl-alcohol dehydrogenase-like predicted oxidoreductase